MQIIKDHNEISDRLIATLSSSCWKKRKIVLNGADVYIEIDQDYEKLHKIANKYPISCIISLCRKRTRDTLTKRFSPKLLKRINTEIFENYDTGIHSLVVAIVTLKKHIRYHIYTKDVKETMSILELLRNYHDKLCFISCSEPDSLWENYMAVNKMLKTA